MWMRTLAWDMLLFMHVKPSVHLGKPNIEENSLSDFSFQNSKGQSWSFTQTGTIVISFESKPKYLGIVFRWICLPILESKVLLSILFVYLHWLRTWIPSIHYGENCTYIQHPRNYKDHGVIFYLEKGQRRIPISKSPMPHQCYPQIPSWIHKSLLQCGLFWASVPLLGFYYLWTYQRRA